MKEVIIYTKNYCPYCDYAKDYFNKNEIPFKEIDVTNNPALIEEMIKKSNGRKTVPEIFIDSKLIGGWDDLSALIQSRKIEQLLEDN